MITVAITAFTCGNIPVNSVVTFLFRIFSVICTTLPGLCTLLSLTDEFKRLVNKVIPQQFRKCLITKSFYQYFCDAIAVQYLPILVFCLFSVAGFGLFAYKSIQEKSPLLLISFAALWLSNFLIHYVVGLFLLRTAQTFCFFAGFVLLIIIEIFADKRFIRRVLYIAVALLVFLQSADMNRWFYNDYARYQKEVFVLNTIATRLIAECDVSKPVVFTNTERLEYLSAYHLYRGNQNNGNSVICWSVNAFTNETQLFVSELFRMHGYHFVKKPNPEQYLKAYTEALNMPPWPEQGCIALRNSLILLLLIVDKTDLLLCA